MQKPVTVCADRDRGSLISLSSNSGAEVCGLGGRQFTCSVDSCQETPHAQLLLGQSLSTPVTRAFPPDSDRLVPGGGFAEAQEHLRRRHVQPQEIHAWPP